jgi:hypothetical protein
MYALRQPVTQTGESRRLPRLSALISRRRAPNPSRTRVGLSSLESPCRSGGSFDRDGCRFAAADAQGRDAATQTVFC